MPLLNLFVHQISVSSECCYTLPLLVFLRRYRREDWRRRVRFDIRASNTERGTYYIMKHFSVMILIVRWYYCNYYYYILPLLKNLIQYCNTNNIIQWPARQTRTNIFRVLYASFIISTQPFLIGFHLKRIFNFR